MNDEMLLSAQVGTCKRHGCDVLTTTSGAMVAAALPSLTNVPIHAIRLDPEGSLSGWYIHGGAYSSDSDFYQPVHLEHVLDVAPYIGPYLGLPPGYRFIIDAQGYEDVWFEQFVEKADDD